MGFFKKKKKFFGKDIEPDCEYCRYNMGEKKIECGYSSNVGEVCKKYEYDPLKREPKPLPKMPTFNPEDFSI